MVFKKSDGFKWNQQYTQFSPEYIKKTFKNSDPDGREGSRDDGIAIG